MSRLGGAFWFILVVASGMTNFLVKQTVQGLDEQLTAVKKKTVAEQKAIHELTADWTFLNQPELLADLNNRYVHLAPVAPRQVIASVDAIPLRPTPPAPPEPAPMAMLPPPPAQMPSAPPPEPIIAAVADQPRHPPAATARASIMPAALSQLASAPQPAPIVPVAVTQPAHIPAPSAAPSVPVAVSPPVHAPPPAAPPHPAKPASLDGLFAQVTGDR
ncbi:MAG TPA: hypothetical protein VFQ90_15265 [Stellaceae bacterium]|nr:hypothetical protein [Stellaceae bacterium]